MNKEQIKTCVWWHMLKEARSSAHSVRLIYDKEEDTVFLEEYVDVIFDKEDIAQRVLRSNKINPDKFKNADWESALDIFEGTLYENYLYDSMYGREWFKIEKELNDQIIVGRYKARTEI